MKSGMRLHARCAGAEARTPFTLAGTERKYERSRPFVIRHILLDLVLDFGKSAVEGTATLDFERIAPAADRLELDAIGFELMSVRSESGDSWSSSHYQYDGDKLSIVVDPEVRAGRVVIAYRVEPRRGLYFLRPDPAVPARPVQVWTQCQDEDARHWFPCHDKPHVKMTTELRVTVPGGFVALSNGEIVTRDTDSERGTSRYHFRIDQPHPSYLVTLVVGEFEVLTDREAICNGRKIPVQYYVPPGRGDDGWRSFVETPRIIELFSRLTGVDFPWTRYSQVVVSDFTFGGMENTTATTMYEHILLDETAALDVSSNELIAHELAHQWFGDYVTCRDWSHAWLNEGFATFFEHLEREERLGRDEYDYGIAADTDTYLREAGRRYMRSIVCRDYHEPIDLFDRHLYEKGGLVLHMLRGALGDELFWRGVRAYLTRHAHGLVETNDFQRALEEVSGLSLDRFFDQWVYRPGHPVLRVKVSWDKGLLEIQVRQRQKGQDVAVFAYELQVEIGFNGGGTERAQKLVTTAADTLVIALGERPSWVAFDPRQQVIGDVRVEAPADMLERQLKAGSTASIRWRAAEALGRRDTVSSIAALERALGNDPEAWMVRAEAARALGRIRGSAAREALAKHTRVEHPKVRRAVAAALGNFKAPEALTALLPLMQDQSYLVQSEACRAAGQTRQKSAYESLLGALERSSWSDIVRAGALDGLAELREEAAVETIIEHTRYGKSSRGRRAAITALARLSEAKRVRQELEDLLDDADPHVRIDVVVALQGMGDPRCRAALHRRLEREHEGRVARRIREALRDIAGGPSADHKRLRDDMEALHNELRELKVRLSKYEDQRTRRAVKAKSKSKATASAKTKRKTQKKSPTKVAQKPREQSLRSRARNERRPHSR